MTFDAFISYSNKDKATADAACAALEAVGIRCWIAPRDVPPGAQWAAAIIGAIDHCRLMVLIFSAHSNSSIQIQREVERSISKGKLIFPLRIEAVKPTDSMEYYLSSIHWLDALTPPLEPHLRRLARTIKSYLETEQDLDDVAARTGAARTANASANGANEAIGEGPAQDSNPRWQWASRVRRWAAPVLLCLLLAAGAGVVIEYLEAPRTTVSENTASSRAAEASAPPLGWQTSSPTVEQPPPAQPSAASPVRQSAVAPPIEPRTAPAPTQQQAAAAPVQQPPPSPGSSHVQRFDGKWIGVLVCATTPSGLPGWQYALIGTVSNGTFHTQLRQKGKPGSETFKGVIEHDGSANISQEGLSGDPSRDPFHRASGTLYSNVYVGSFDGSHGKFTRADRSSCTISLTKQTETQASQGKSSE